MQLNLPELAEVLEEIEFFERERTDRQSVMSAKTFVGRAGEPARKTIFTPISQS